MPGEGDAVGPISHLLYRCGRGDEAALGRIFDLFYEVVAAALEEKRSAETLVVQGFLQVWINAPTYRPQDQGPVAWIMRHAVGQ